jgi:hypothetical protein
MALIPKSKNIKWQARLKSMTHTLVAYKKHISLTKANIGLGEKGAERFSKQLYWKQAGVASYTYIW